MSYETVIYEERGPVAVITYNRPERRNAWNVQLCREAMDAVEHANADDAIGAMVITNTGDVFCAGADFKAPPEPRDPETGRRPNVATIAMAEDHSWLHLLARSKPNIVAVNGAAIGLGVTQTLAADIRMGGESSTYGFAFLARSTMPEFGCTALLPRVVGYGRAVDIILGAETLSAQQALDIGLITRVAPDAELVDRAVELAGRLAAYPEPQISLTRQMLQANAVESDLNALLKTERDAFIKMMKQAGTTAPKTSTVKPAK